VILRTTNINQTRKTPSLILSLYTHLL